MEEKIIEIRLHVPKIHLSPKIWKWGLAGLLVVALAENPATESVTLTTYYPAPAGAYNNIVTVGNTWLARDNIPMTTTPSFVEMGNNIFSGGNDVKLDVENGSIRLTDSASGNPSDHWIGSDGPSGTYLGINGQTGGGVDIDIGNSPVVNVNQNQEIQFNGAVSAGPFTTSPPSNTYLHINNWANCQLWGPGYRTCNGANYSGYGAEGCNCPAGSYATWAPGLYPEPSEYPNQYEWGVWVQPSGGGSPYYAGVDSYSAPIQVNIRMNYPGMTAIQGMETVLVPGANYDPLTNPSGVSQAYGSEFFYCCPK